MTLGYLEQGPSRKYRLASRVSDIALWMLDSMEIRRVAREPLRELMARTGRTASLVVLSGTEVAYIDRWQGSRQGQYGVDEGIGLGIRLPIHCAAAGKALLARLPVAEQQERVTRLGLTRLTSTTITTKNASRTESKRIAADGGVAVEDEELSVGRRALAATVTDADGWPIATVELAVPARAYSRKELLVELGPKVMATARRIAVTLGEPSHGSQTDKQC